MQQNKVERTSKDKEPVWVKRLGCILFIGLPGTIICLPIAYCVLTLLIPAWIESGSFCSTDNEIYRLIESNAYNWLEGFRKGDTSVIQFKNSSDRTYSAISTNYRTVDAESFFVQLEYSRRDKEGSWGFYFDPTGLPYIHALYKVEHLEGDIYCYWRSG